MQVTWGLRVREHGRYIPSQEQGSCTLPVDKAQEIQDGFTGEVVMGKHTAFRSWGLGPGFSGRRLRPAQAGFVGALVSSPSLLRLATNPACCAASGPALRWKGLVLTGPGSRLGSSAELAGLDHLVLRVSAGPVHMGGSWLI